MRLVTHLLYRVALLITAVAATACSGARSIQYEGRYDGPLTDIHQFNNGTYLITLTTDDGVIRLADISPEGLFGVIDSLKVRQGRQVSIFWTKFRSRVSDEAWTRIDSVHYAVSLFDSPSSR